MRKSNERRLDSGIYARISEAHMNEYDRHAALRYLHSAELFVDGLVWVKEKFATLGHYFLSPSLKH